ncbi:MAG: Crp/Fnr family transcriptional regulator [Alphaproteobacteria bacterium]|nr:Crp/Fnr family transcriptional regulator [Alphaproteobacteria bacterium]
MPNSQYPLHRPELSELLRTGDATLRQAMGPPLLRREGETLVRTGEESEEVYLLESGWTARTRMLTDGRQQIILVFLPGDLMGIKSMLLNRQPDTIECLTDVSVRTIDHRRLLDLSTQDRAVGVRVMFQLAEDERRTHNWVAALGKGNAEERIATLLLDLRGRLSRAGLASGDNFRMPMTQQEIADHLGLTLVHVNRVLRRMRETGVVTVQRGAVKVDEMARLSRMAAPLQDIFERANPEFGGQAESA